MTPSQRGRIAGMTNGGRLTVEEARAVVLEGKPIIRHYWVRCKGRGNRRVQIARRIA